MPLKVSVGGRTGRSDHLTLGDVLAIEAMTGKPWPQFNPFGSARDAYALVLALFGPEGAEAARHQSADVSKWIELVDDDLPEAFRECIPTLGGESFDSYIVAFADPQGFGWPPDVTRRQRVRDLDLLQAAFRHRHGKKRQ